MGILDIFGIGKGLAEPIKAVGSLYTTDKERLDALTKLESETNKSQLSQLANNSLMLKSAHFFESAWPALIGWTSGGCVAMYYIPQLVIILYVWGSNCIHSGIITTFPMKPDDILNLVYLLFGFGTYNLAKTKMFNN